MMVLLAFGCGRDSPTGPRTSEAAAQSEASETCQFPEWRPTYLPWLGPGDPVPEPVTDRSSSGGGPDGTDPGYSMLVWGYGDISTSAGPRLEGTVALWRSTESVGALPVDPDVPQLPDGGEGRFYEGEANDWAIVWGDVPGDSEDMCDETVLTLTMPHLSSENQRTELVEVAGSLVHDDDL
jgi:hypothetical protein